MANRGFDISEDLVFRGTTLFIPQFTKEKWQLSQWEVKCQGHFQASGYMWYGLLGELNITRSYNTHFQYRYSKQFTTTLSIMI